MRTALRSKSTAIAAVLLAAGTIATSPVPALAQDEISESRLRKIEAEIRALQRNVFPGGDGRFFEPQIASGESTASANGVTAPSTTAVTDILARLDALEAQIQRLTAQSEENGNALNRMEERLAAVEAGSVGAAPSLVATAASDATEDAGVNADADAGGDDAPATDSNLLAMTGGASGAEDDAAETASSAGPSAERLAAVQEITKPQTDDAGDDEYSYGFRLWNAGFYPEARQQLSKFVEDYPSHYRITFGRNLLGRAFLDDGMAEEAARWFLRNYQADRTAARAPDSLLYLAESMIALEDTRRACIALAEFGETYPAVASGRLMDQYEANRRKVSCDQA